MDYYPGGMTMQGRSYTASTSSSYRYGMNGQEKSSEINSDGNLYTAEHWGYDSRINRRWNVDPVTKDDESPYMVFGNNPIVMVDPNGADWYKNRSTGNVEYKAKWHRNHKEYESLGKGNGDVLTYQGKEYNKKTGEITAILDAVVVTTTTKARKKEDAGSAASYGFYWAIYDNLDAQRWDEYRATVRDLKAANQSLNYNGAPQEYLDLLPNLQREWQADQDWRSTQYYILEGASFFVPVPKLGMGRWLFGSSVGRALWSGAGTEAMAISEGFTTLSTTRAGKIMSFVTARMPYRPGSLSYKMWGGLSRYWVKTASGTVHIFQNAERGTELLSIFRTSEWDALKANKNVSGWLFVY